MGEFVNGFERIGMIEPCVSIFGSARTKPSHKYYKETILLAKKIVQQGFGVITGGGPGIMEAANKGAQLGGGTSVGLNIELPFEQYPTPFIDDDKLCCKDNTAIVLHIEKPEGKNKMTQKDFINGYIWRGMIK